MSPGKRIRCSSPPQAAAAAVAEWSALPDLLLDLILCKLTSSLKDCLSLAATCRQWRSAAKQSKTSITMNWLMSTTPDNDRPATAFPVFHDVVSAKRHHLYLPEIEGFTVFGSRFGWLVACRARAGMLEPEIKLVNPISAASIPLPTLTDGFGSRVVNAVLTASPDGDSSGCFVVVEHARGRLAFARPGGGSSWLRVPGDFYVHSFACSGVNLYCLRRVEAADSYSCVRYSLTGSDTEITGNEFAIPPELLDHPANSRMEPVGFYNSIGGFERLQKLFYTKYHLAEIKGRLCLVVKFFTGGSHSFFEIFEFELGTGQWSRVESLGDSCLVVQDNLNISIVDARDDPELVPGCVYYPISDAGCLHDPFKWWRQRIRLRRPPYISEDSEKNSISRLIYYPSTSKYDNRTRVWATSQYCTRLWGFEIEPPRHLERYDDSWDTYSKIYPSILVRVNPSLASYLQRYDRHFLDDLETIFTSTNKQKFEELC